MTTLISEFSDRSDESGCFVSCVDQWMGGWMGAGVRKKELLCNT